MTTDRERGGETRPHRIGICFNVFEPFYWDADREGTCPGCPIESEDDDHRAEHRFYVSDDTDELREIARALDEAATLGPNGAGRMLIARDRLSALLSDRTPTEEEAEDGC